MPNRTQRKMYSKCGNKKKTITKDSVDGKTVIQKEGKIKTFSTKPKMRDFIAIDIPNIKI